MGLMAFGAMFPGFLGLFLNLSRSRPKGHLARGRHQVTTLSFVSSIAATDTLVPLTRNLPAYWTLYPPPPIPLSPQATNRQQSEHYHEGARFAVHQMCTSNDRSGSGSGVRGRVRSRLRNRSVTVEVGSGRLGLG